MSVPIFQNRILSTKLIYKTVNPIQAIEQEGDPSKPTDPMQHMTKSRAKLWNGSFLEAPHESKNK